jgi:hypothetical protein
MATIASLTSLVVEQTKRPEVGSITLAAIKSAILRAHHTDFFPRDLREAILTYSLPGVQPLYQDFPNLSALAANLRSIKIVYGVDSVTGAHVEKLEYRELDDLYDSNGVLRPGVYSLVGDTLRCYYQVWTGATQLIYYANPSFTATDAVSWIADMYPDEIAAWAAGIVFARTGFTEMAQNFQEIHVKPFKETLIASHLLGNVN